MRMVARIQVRGLGRGARWALGLAWRGAAHLVVGHAALAAAWSLVPLVIAWLTKLALDTVVSPAVDTGRLVGLGLALAAAGLAAAGLPHADRYVRAETERRVGLAAQDRLFAATERLTGLARFEDPAFLDRLRLAHQSGGTTPGQVVAGVLSLGRGLVTAAGFVASLLVISRPMAAAVLLAAVPALGAELALSGRRAALLWRIGPILRREFFYQDLLATERAAKEIRLLGIGAHLRERMSAERRTANAHRRALDRRELAVHGGLTLLAAGIAGAGLVWALMAAGQGRLTAGDVSLFVAAVAGVQAAIAALVAEVAATHQQLLLSQHYLAVLDAGPDLPRAAQPCQVPRLRRGIELRNVWFRYSPEHPWALRGVNLSIPYGQSVALVGRNGAGKSTVVKLLCRMYDPQRGAVLWDGVDLRDMDPAALRERIGAVFQDFMEYELSAADNIGLGDLSRRTDPRVIAAAAERAGVHDTLAALPRGYDTLLTRMFVDGEDGAGVPLSGGQWQRVALARAYLRGERDLLILDEPSAGLDPEAECEIHSGLGRLRAGRTSLLISHRLSAVRHADRLVVLDKGRVVEEGTHAGLVGAGGMYQRLFNMQASGYHPAAAR
jgi:ATP-binding cassette, subfamily B, bacterial